MRELDVIAAQLGRAPRAKSAVAARCKLALPIVVEVPPVLEHGEPFPTRFWLSCPLAHRRIARLEADGGVKQFEERRKTDPAFSKEVAETHARYERERDALIEGDPKHRPRGGVGGSNGGVKCLHAHFADAAAGNTNPIGREVADAIGPLICATPCVHERDEAVVKNSAWREPPRDDG